MKNLFLVLLLSCFALNGLAEQKNVSTVEVNLAEPNWISEAEHLTLDSLDSLKAESFDFSQPDARGNTLFYYVLTKNPQPNLIRKLIEYGANVNLPAKNGILPLNIITSKANEIQLQVLMMQTMGLDIHDPKIKDSLEESIFQQMSAMTDVAKILIEAGADINKKSPLGTPLMNAATNAWNLDIVKLLINSGADVNALDSLGRTALFYAALAGNNEIIDTLIKAGADPNIKDSSGKTFSDVLKVETDQK